MIINVLAIGDVGNIISTLSKFTKKSKIHLINFHKDGAGVFTYNEDVETFENYKVKDHVEKINSIKNNYDIAITMGTGERIAYLADLNYIPFYVGRDIDAPRFEKNSSEDWSEEPLHKLNFLERRFYWNSFNSAIVHVAYGWVFGHLKKYTKNGIKLDMVPIDTTIFHPRVTPIKKEKKKFTFFSPMRMEKFKGTNLLFDALKFCKSDFEIIAVDHFGEATKEEIEFKNKLLANMPKQVKLIQPVKRSEMPRYYTFADAVLGNFYLGMSELVTLESVMCGTPVIQYSDENKEIIVNDEKLKLPFLPHSKNPKEIAKIIDNFVESPQFRIESYNQQLEFVKKTSDPNKCAEWWDNLFENMIKRHKSIMKNSSRFSMKLRMLNFLIANRLYFYKLKKIFQTK
tara:strand:- start:110 stop:1309 length:1200 start_codon:yes stop_codon:yes gene_type:complete